MRVVSAAAAGFVVCAGALAQDATPKPAAPTKPGSTEGTRMEMPKVGAAAPDFKIKDHANKDVSLADFKGKKNVLLAFFPKAFTGG